MHLIMGLGNAHYGTERVIDALSVRQMHHHSGNLRRGFWAFVWVSWSIIGLDLHSGLTARFAVLPGISSAAE